MQRKTTIRGIWTAFDKDPESIINKYVKIGGRIFTERGNEKLEFIEFSDGSTVRTLQCVCDREKFLDLPWDKLWEHANRGATMAFYGKIVSSPAKGQPIELSVESFDLWGRMPEDYQLASRGKIGRDFLRTIPHLRHHTKLFTAIQIIKQTVYKAFHDSMADLGIGELQPTLITGNECESGAFPFSVTTLLKDKIGDTPLKEKTDLVDYSQDFFGKKVYLTVSSQLHLEATVCGTCRDGYVMTTAFRAEPSKGPLHLAEFLMPEWELVDCGLLGNMQVAQHSLQHCFKQVLEKCKYELEYLEEYRLKDLQDQHLKDLSDHKKKRGMVTKQEWVTMKKKLYSTHEEKKARPSIITRLEKYIKEDFIVTTHAECVRLMLKDVADNKVQFTENPGYADDFSKEHERYITEQLYDGLPVFVTQYPKQIKAFYMPVVDKGMEVEHVDCYDLLFPYVGEVVGGSQRIHDHDDLVERMDEYGIDKESLQWYLDLRKFGTVPHGGAGLGFGRLFLVITDIFNIKDMQEFPRGYGGICHA